MTIFGHGPTAREQQILDMYDARIEYDAIAAQLEVKVSYAKQVVARLHRPTFEDWQSPAAEASECLLAALRRHHPERCGA
jgi:hypothetical protein